MADKAVLCGINDYASISDLSGCLNDVANLENLLLEDYGFDSDNIHTLLDDDVTKANVVDAFEWLASEASDEDRLIFHFSGHGSYTPSQDDDETQDELICLYPMDWSQPDSYLIDDDLGDLTRKIQKGRLTVILDCCHSGSGTRAITQDFGNAKSVTQRTRLMIKADTARHISSGNYEENMRRLESGNTALTRSFRDSTQNVVYARFVEPPVAIRKSGPLRFRKLGLAMRAAPELNHQLLAGARDNQTAADAFIAGQYNGAFTYYLCQSARDDSNASYNQIMESTVNQVRDNGYSQVPQNEGPFGNEKLFGGVAVSGAGQGSGFGNPVSQADDGTGTPASLKSQGDPSQDSPLSILSNLLRVSEKLVDLASSGYDATPSGRISFAADSRSGGDVVVYVHGISRHITGYSVPWFNAMQPHLDSSLERQEVLWSPIVNARSSAGTDVSSLTSEIESELQRRARQIEAQLPAQQRNLRMEQPRGSGFAIDDFARYMLSRDIREAILAEFDQVVRPLLSAGRNIHIVSHSWGTVVSYEGLRRMDNDALSGQVLNLFTVGSALSISQVRSNLFGRVTDGRRPQHVNDIINLDAGNDLVGGGIGDHFFVTREFLGLDPVGCAKIPFTNLALNPVCAHSSYFNAANLEVNRDIFARRINAA